MTLTKLIDIIPFGPFFVKSIVFLLYVFNKTIFYTLKKNKKSEKIAVLCLQKIGDTIFTIPSIRYLNKKFGAKLVVICFEDTEILLKKFVDEKLETVCLSRDDIGYKENLVKFRRLKKIRLRNYQQIYDLTGNIVSFSVLFRLFSERIYGINDRFYSIFFNKFTVKEKDDKLTDLFFKVIHLIDDNAKIDLFSAQPIKDISKINIILNPFGGWAAKEWNFEKFIKLYNLLRKDFEVLINIDSSHNKPIYTEPFKQNNIKYVVSHNLLELISFLNDYTFFIGNDSGPLYIAAMLGIPTLTIYGPTNPMHSMPKEIYHTYIRKEIKCSPQGNEQYCHTSAGRFNCPKFDCMDSLTVEEVYKHFIDFSKKIIERRFDGRN